MDPTALVNQDRGLAESNNDKLQLLQIWDGAESLKFLNHFFEVVEELRLRRIADVENEEKINALVKEKHLLEGDYETLKSKVKSSEDELELRLFEARKSYESQLSDAQKHCARQDTCLEVALNEITTLRAEIRNLQILRHSLEKLIRDQEMKIQQQNGALENCLKQLTELERRFQHASRDVSTLEEEQAKLESNVRHALKTNDELARALQHQNSILAESREEMDRLKGRKLQGNIKSQIDGWNEAFHRNPKDDLSLALKLDLEANKAASSDLTKKLKAAEDEYQKTVKLLNDCHELLSHYVLTNSQLYQENASFKHSLSKVNEQNNVQKEHDKELEGSKEHPEQQQVPDDQFKSLLQKVDVPEGYNTQQTTTDCKTFKAVDNFQNDNSIHGNQPDTKQLSSCKVLEDFNEQAPENLEIMEALAMMSKELHERKHGSIHLVEKKNPSDLSHNFSLDWSGNKTAKEHAGIVWTEHHFS